MQASFPAGGPVAPPPQRSSKTWLWVALGCGLLLILGLCVAGGVGFYLSREHMNAAEMEDAILPLAPVPGPAGYAPVAGAGYAFSVPATWEKVEFAQVDVAYRDTALKPFVANVNLVIEPFFGTTQAYLEASKASIGAAAQIRRESPATVGSLSAMDLEATWSNPERTAFQRFVATGGKGYVLTCTIPIDDAGVDRAICDVIFSTFRVGS